MFLIDYSTDSDMRRFCTEEPLPALKNLLSKRKVRESNDLAHADRNGSGSGKCWDTCVKTTDSHDSLDGYCKER